jgi:3-methylcrotonyl-CoA carboxylase alpha subunit
MFEKLLIANRGEIACRIIRTAKRLGIMTVAIYSEADEGAMHADMADEAWPIGPAPARESYLAIDKIVEIAERSGVQAVHPGYGFLSEDARFAERCIEAALAFIGPPPAAMRLMGSKASAKMVMERAGVPIVPGYHGDAMDPATLSEAAERTGFPLLIKASNGGGGRGMRVVREPGELAEAIASSRREALASFGDDRLLIERYLTHPRHIEIQIFADSCGDCVSFLERDCSMQRRHQKILEETPASGLSENLRREMRDAATAAAQAVGYVGAGTIEFLVQDGEFFFLEMNTRLQVEHPVTEMISGQDLVEWQLRIACGEKLPVTQEALVMQGCAVEVRVCAEDPARDFLPSVGKIDHFRTPPKHDALRIDTGVRSGDRVTQYYDSLLAKLIVWGRDRSETLLLLRAALSGCELVGVATNLDLLRALAAHPLFLEGEFDTGFIEREVKRLTAETPSAQNLEPFVVAAGAAVWLADLRRREREKAAECGDSWSPWSLADGWRIDGVGSHDVEFMRDARKMHMKIHPLAGGSFRLDTQTGSTTVNAHEDGDRLRLCVDGLTREVGVVRRGVELVVIMEGRNHSFVVVDPLEPPAADAGPEQQLRAPLPARVTRVLVSEGEDVKKGEPLVILEVMKMEVAMTAPRDGRIESILCKEGEWMAEGEKLANLFEDKAA